MGLFVKDLPRDVMLDTARIAVRRTDTDAIYNKLEQRIRLTFPKTNSYTLGVAGAGYDCNFSVLCALHSEKTYGIILSASMNIVFHSNEDSLENLVERYFRYVGDNAYETRNILVLAENSIRECIKLCLKTGFGFCRDKYQLSKLQKQLYGDSYFEAEYGQLTIYFYNAGKTRYIVKKIIL